MANPFARVALALSYIKGPNVDDWVAQQIDEVYWKVHGDPTRNPPLQPTHRDDDERLWTEFVNDFTDAFGDTAEAERAYGDLQKLELKGNRVDDYIATFEKLLRRAGWD